MAISQLHTHEDGCGGGPSTASPTTEKVFLISPEVVFISFPPMGFTN